MSLNFGTSFMSTERETESCKVFVGFVLPSTGISNPGMTYRDRAMGHWLWMDGWTRWMTRRMDGKLHQNDHDILVWTPCLIHMCVCIWRYILQNQIWSTNFLNNCLHSWWHTENPMLKSGNLLLFFRLTFGFWDLPKSLHFWIFEFFISLFSEISLVKIMTSRA